MKMTFAVWAYWQWAKLKCAALEVKMVRDISEYLAYLISEIRNPDRDYIPELCLPGPSLSFEAQVTGTRKEKRKPRGPVTRDKDHTHSAIRAAFIHQ